MLCNYVDKVFKVITKLSTTTPISVTFFKLYLAFPSGRRGTALAVDEVFEVITKLTITTLIDITFLNYTSLPPKT